MKTNCGTVAAVHQTAHGDIGVCGIGFDINPVALLWNQRTPGDQINGRGAVVYACAIIHACGVVIVIEVDSIVFTGDIIDVNVDQGIAVNGLHIKGNTLPITDVNLARHGDVGGCCTPASLSKAIYPIPHWSNVIDVDERGSIPQRGIGLERYPLSPFRSEMPGCSNGRKSWTRRTVIVDIKRLTAGSNVIHIDEYSGIAFKSRSHHFNPGTVFWSNRAWDIKIKQYISSLVMAVNIECVIQRINVIQLDSGLDVPLLREGIGV